MKNLNNIEIKVVGGGDLNCPKTVTATASAIITGCGTLLAALGSSIHITAPDITDPKLPKYQRNFGLAFAITGYLLNVGSMALATLSGAQANCVDPITNTTTPNP
jgi:hypothetical protein